MKRPASVQDPVVELLRSAAPTEEESRPPETLDSGDEVYSFKLNSQLINQQIDSKYIYIYKHGMPSCEYLYMCIDSLASGFWDQSHLGPSVLVPNRGPSNTDPRKQGLERALKGH